jgi:hypothetical protein
MTEQNKQVTEAQALEALDNLDDYAKMAISVDPVGPREILHRFIEQNNQPPAEAGEGAVAKIIRNASGQITIQGPDGDYFDMSEHIGATLYTSQTTATQAAVATAMRKAAREVYSFTGIQEATRNHLIERILSSIPAEATAALRELMIAAADEGWDAGCEYLTGTGPVTNAASIADRILAEKELK